MKGTCGVQTNVITFNASISSCRQCWPRALFLHAQLGVSLGKIPDIPWLDCCHSEIWSHLKPICGSQIWNGWWFGTFFVVPYIGNNHPNWLMINTTRTIYRYKFFCRLGCSNRNWQIDTEIQDHYPHQGLERKCSIRAVFVFCLYK